MASKTRMLKRAKERKNVQPQNKPQTITPFERQELYKQAFKHGFEEGFEMGYKEGAAKTADEVTHKAAEYMAVATIAMSSKVIMEHWGDLHKRDTRVNTYLQLFKALIEGPWQDGRLEAYYALLESYGDHVVWHNESQEEYIRKMVDGDGQGDGEDGQRESEDQQLQEQDAEQQKV